MSDKEARKKIITDISKNYFVEASAGSGKTTSLVYRMVSLVEQGEPIEKICTITFTIAAANEFFERFQKILSIRSGDTPHDCDDYLGERNKDTKRRCIEALSKIDLCFLGTLDSFCNKIAHEMPAELGIPSSSEIISEEEFSLLAKEKFDSVLRDDEHHLHELGLKFNQFIPHSYDAFAAGLKTIRDLRNLKLIFREDIVDSSFDDYFDKNDKDNVLEIFNDFTQMSADALFINKVPKGDEATNGKLQERIKAREELGSKYKILNDVKYTWENNISDLVYGIKNVKTMNTFGDQVDCDCAIGKYLNEKNKFSDSFIERLKKIEDKINEYFYSLYFKFVISVLDELVDELRVKGKFRFFDFLLYLRNAFRESALSDRVLVDYVKNKYDHFLLDESQDTNPMQTELFFYLTGTKKDQDWKKLEPKEGSIFIVGDPKQSIYGFRGADVKAYLDNKEIFNKKKEVLYLTSNFRSHAHLRKWFNDTFDTMLNYKSGALKDFALEHPEIPIDRDDPTWGYTLNNPNVLEGVYRYVVQTSGRNDDLDCEQMAKLIVDAVSNKKEIWYLKKDDNGVKSPDTRKISYKDFLVVPPFSKMELIVSEFKKWNIPMVVEGKIDFRASETYCLVLDFLYLLKQPSNRALFNNVVFSKYYGLCESDIVQMLNDGFDLDISNITNTDGSEIQFTLPKHKTIVEQLHNLYIKTSCLSFSSIMMMLLNDTDLNIFSKISSKDLEYIYYLIEKVKEGEENGSINTIEELKNYIDHSFGKGDEQRIVRFEKEIDRVKIANTHKVKGLQAPIVILARPFNKTRKPQRFIDYTAAEPYMEFAYISGDNQNYVQTSSFENELEKWKAYDQSEHDRLVYVGATRAEAALIICEKAPPKSAKKGEEVSKGYWAELLNDHPDLRTLSEPTVSRPETTTFDVSLGKLGIDFNSHKESFEFISPSQSRHNARTNKDEIDDAEFDNGDEEREAATLKGTMVHKLMECIISSKNSYNIEELIKTILSDYGYSKEHDKMLHNIASKILNGGYEQVNSSLDKDILKTLLDAKKVWCEVSFSYQSNKGNIVHGIIDCMYLDKNDKYHVIDYKTNKENDVSELEKHYEGQLTHYKLALKKMGIEADAHIYHIDL